MTRDRYSNDENLAVTVEAGARLHLGFLDLNGGLGRRFGSMGLAIDGFQTRLTATLADTVGASGPSAHRARGHAIQVVNALGLESGVHIAVHEAIPGHLGLGSGTQLGLAVGIAVTRLHGVELAPATVAGIADRGARSGIGIGSFDQGGFILDGGRGPDDGTPPVISRLPYPEDWRVVLVLDARGEGIHGSEEKAAFHRLPPFPGDHAAHLCRLALMQILPAVAEGRLEPFARGVAEVQRVVGDHFAAAQGGRYTSPAVSDVLTWAEAQGFAGVGQSSWGPTGFVLTATPAAADDLVRAARWRFGDLSAVRFCVVRGCNHGSRISITSPMQTLKRAP
ncbi:MAG: beta-ribofuranosylaminobenzene 5'-phosphate synthase family protein [Gammaproteobacteria bacterium]|nr:beta-ribofuranosylaminobenzene 5'-phosphate synthase family protein [Gammaproteobacteria bacterium]